MACDADHKRRLHSCDVGCGLLHASFAKQLFHGRHGRPVETQFSKLREIVQHRNLERFIVHLFAAMRQVDGPGLIRLIGDQVRVGEIRVDPGLLIIQMQRGLGCLDGLGQMSR